MSTPRRQHRRPPRDTSPNVTGLPPRRPRPRSRHRPPFPGALIRLPAGRFRPRHCPNLHCRFYEPHPDWRYTLWGSYKAPSCRQLLPRFQCSHCRRTFTPRTFAATYWLHRFDLFALIAQAAVAGAGVRQIARTFHVSHSTVARHLTRAGRLCLVFHRRLLEKVPLREPVVIDGFETFEYSQYFPCHYNLAVGQESWFLYHFTDSPLRRKGTMTRAQRKRRGDLETALGRPDPKAVENGIFELLRVVLDRTPLGTAGQIRDEVASPLPPSHPPSTPFSTPSSSPSPPIVRVHSDGHPAYERAVRRLRRTLDLPAAKGENPLLEHHQTPSTDPRTRANNLFPVNLADLLLRHSGADHRRETIAYDKRRQGGLERLAVFAVWRNTIKWRRENHPGETAAMTAGVAKRRLRWAEVFARRQFPRERELPGPWWDYYWRRVKTLALGVRQTENRAVFAF